MVFISLALVMTSACPYVFGVEDVCCFHLLAVVFLLGFSSGCLCHAPVQHGSQTRPSRPSPGTWIQVERLEGRQLAPRSPLQDMLFSILSIWGAIPHPFYILLSFWYICRFSSVAWGQRTLMHTFLASSFTRDKIQCV